MFAVLFACHSSEARVDVAGVVIPKAVISKTVISKAGFSRDLNSRHARGLRIALLLLALPIGSGCSGFDMLEPKPVPVASSPERTESAMFDAIRREGWSTDDRRGGHLLIYREIEGVTLKARVLVRKSMIEVHYVPDSSGLSGEEKDAHLRRVRRSLHDLQERIEYLIESADLTAD